MPKPPLDYDDDPADDGPGLDTPPETETGYCPECGAEIWDQADICPKCFSYIGGEVLHRPPMERWWRQKWRIVVIVAVLAAFAIVALR